MCGGMFDWVSDIFDPVLDVFEGAGGAITDVAGSVMEPVSDTALSVIDDGMDWAMDEFIPTVLPAVVAYMSGNAVGGAMGGILEGGGETFMSGMDLAADGGLGNVWGMDAGFGNALGNVADGAGLSLAPEMSSTPSWISDLSSMSSAPGVSSAPSWMAELPNTGVSSWSAGNLAKKGVEKIGGGFLEHKIKELFKDQKVGDLGNLIAGMQSRNTQGNVGTGTRQAIDDMYAKINGLYAEGSPELMQMRQAMERKDAAAGRRSQYGPREAELAGNIAKYKADAIQRVGLGSLPKYVESLNTSANRNSGLYSAMNKMLGSTSLGDVINGISNVTSGFGSNAWAQGLKTGSYNGDQLYG